MGVLVELIRSSLSLGWLGLAHSSPRLRAGGRQDREHDAGALFARDCRAVAFQVVSKFSVVLEPPECRAWKYDVAGALGAQLLELRDSLGAVVRVIAGIAPVLIPWKVPGLPSG